MAKMIWWDDDIIQYEGMCSVRDVNAPQMMCFRWWCRATSRNFNKWRWKWCGNPVDGSETLPTSWGKGSWSHYFMSGFFRTIPGGWRWDFLTTNSMGKTQSQWPCIQGEPFKTLWGVKLLHFHAFAFVSSPLDTSRLKSVRRSFWQMTGMQWVIHGNDLIHGNSAPKKHL